MNTSRIAVITAATGLVAWLGKATAIGLAGGQDHTPLVDALFLAGLLANVVAVVAISLTLAHDRSRLVRIGAVLAGTAVMLAFVTVLNLAILRIQPADASWVWAELNLWITAALTLGLAVRLHRGSRAQAVEQVPDRRLLSHP